MEHRHYPRLKVSMDVSVFARQCLLGNFKSQNISLDGIFLKVNPNQISRNSVLDFCHENNGKKWRWRGFVVHESQRGVGVMLDESSKQTFQALFSQYKNQQLSSPQPMANQPIDASKPSVSRHAESVNSPLLSATEFPSASYSDPMKMSESISLQSVDSQVVPRKSLRIRIGNRFDISSTQLVFRVIKAIQSDSLQDVVIDFRATQFLQDSGLALLILMYNKVGQLKERISITNCDKDIFNKLAKSKIHCLVNIDRQ